MGNTNYKMILDKTFMLLDQAINEKKAEQATQKRLGKYRDVKDDYFKKTIKQRYTRQ